MILASQCGAGPYLTNGHSIEVHTYIIQLQKYSVR